MKFYLNPCNDKVSRILEEAPGLQTYFFNTTGKTLEIEQTEENGYQIIFSNEKCRILYRTVPQLCRALLYAASLTREETVKEKCIFPEFGVMLDVSRNAVLRIKTLKKCIRLAAFLGYSFVGLYMEDTIKIKKEPYFGYMRGALTENEIKEVDAYAKQYGIELRPYIQTLAHLNQIVRYEEYQKMIDTDDILLAGSERTKQLLENLIESVAGSFSSRNINIGMDEARMMGLGKYLEQHGYEDRLKIMSQHLEMVLEICQKYGFHVQMWSDMFFRLAFHGEYYGNEVDELKKIQIPENLELGYWDYYSIDPSHYDDMLKRHKLLTDRIAFIGSAWKWTGFIPHNRYSINNGKAALAACKNQKIKSVTITCWGDDGAEASVFSVLPTLYENARIAYESEMQYRAFELLTGHSMEEFFVLDEVNPYIEDGTVHNNASKYLLYNDPFIGIFDSVVPNNITDYFRKTSRKLEQICKEKSETEFSYLFETAWNLCQVLEIKADLGNRIKEAYDQDETQILKKLAQEELPELIEKLEIFYKRFRNQWYQENKSFGFEVQTVRLGGLIQRVKDVKQILEAYLCGMCSMIEILEEERLPFHYFEEQDIRKLNYNLWSDIVSPSKI